MSYELCLSVQSAGLTMPRGRKRTVRRKWTAQDERELKRHSKNGTPAARISKALKPLSAL